MKWVNDDSYSIINLMMYAAFIIGTASFIMWMICH